MDPASPTNLQGAAEGGALCWGDLVTSLCPLIWFFIRPCCETELGFCLEHKYIFPPPPLRPPLL